MNSWRRLYPHYIPLHVSSTASHSTLEISTLNNSGKFPEWRSQGEKEEGEIARSPPLGQTVNSEGLFHGLYPNFLYVGTA
jgi:hypothetical protein